MRGVQRTNVVILQVDMQAPVGTCSCVPLLVECKCSHTLIVLFNCIQTSEPSHFYLKYLYVYRYLYEALNVF